jgi:hypothetical protein
MRGSSAGSPSGCSTSTTSWRARAGRFRDRVGGALWVRPARVVAIRFSNGANIAAALMLLRPRSSPGPSSCVPWFRSCPSTCLRCPGAASGGGGRSDPSCPRPTAGHCRAAPPSRAEVSAHCPGRARARARRRGRRRGRWQASAQVTVPTHCAIKRSRPAPRSSTG